MEVTKPSPSTVEAKEGGPSQVDVLQGPVDCGAGCWPEDTYSLATSNFLPLIVQVVEGGVYIGAKHKYFGFVRVETVPPPCAILGYNVNHRLQVFTGGGNKGEIVCIHWSSTEYAANSHTESRMFKFH